MLGKNAAVDVCCILNLHAPRHVLGYHRAMQGALTISPLISRRVREAAQLRQTAHDLSKTVAWDRKLSFEAFSTGSGDGNLARKSPCGSKLNLFAWFRACL